MITDDQRTALIQAAIEVRAQAYAPYSNYSVGAALLMEDGRIITGVNVENASYGLSICAERTAVFKAISEGYRKFLAVAVVTDHRQCRLPLRRLPPSAHGICWGCASLFGG